VLSVPEGKELFRAKGAKPSRCGLTDIPHLTSVAFVPGHDNQVVVVGTVKVRAGCLFPLPQVVVVGIMKVVDRAAFLEGGGGHLIIPGNPGWHGCSHGVLFGA
jgi:hypothetical protein